MHFNVSQLMAEPSGSSRTFQVDEEYPSLEGDREHRAVGSVQLMRTDRGIWVSAALDSDVVCICSRCLLQYVQSIHLDIEEESLPLGGTPPDGTSGLPASKWERLLIGYEQTLDITEAVRQYAELGTPMKPVCRLSCAGICMDCGADLNEETCSCDQRSPDRRWGALLALSSSEGSRGGP
jgi:uncharacterized protein